jgi:prolyl-tRNA editing enzyme YbaK/EbsC (Cys-tRNA(Pro) deacylase)
LYSRGNKESGKNDETKILNNFRTDEKIERWLQAQNDVGNVMNTNWRELKSTDARGALVELLREFRVEYTLIEHAESGKTSESAAHAIGEKRSNIVKSMLLRNDRSEYLGIIVDGDQKIDFYKVRECARTTGGFGSNKFSFARPDEIKTVLRFEIGGVPPFAFYMNGIAAFVDSGVMRKEFVVGAGGNEFSGIKFSPKEFAKFGYTVADIGV